MNKEVKPNIDDNWRVLGIIIFWWVIITIGSFLLGWFIFGHLLHDPEDDRLHNMCAHWIIIPGDYSMYQLCRETNGNMFNEE